MNAEKIDTKIDKLNRLINYRGGREQAQFAYEKKKTGMKQCYTRGCEVFYPLMFALKGANLSDILIFDRMFTGEEPARAWLW